MPTAPRSGVPDAGVPTATALRAALRAGQRSRADAHLADGRRILREAERALEHVLTDPHRVRDSSAWPGKRFADFSEDSCRRVLADLERADPWTRARAWQELGRAQRAAADKLARHAGEDPLDRFGSPELMQHNLRAAVEDVRALRCAGHRPSAVVLVPRRVQPATCGRRRRPARRVVKSGSPPGDSDSSESEPGPARRTSTTAETAALQLTGDLRGRP